MKIRQLLSFSLVFLLTSCFETHPYDVWVDGEKEINKAQIETIEKKFAGELTKPLRVAFLSDTHLWLADAKDQVEDVNRRIDNGEIDFVAHLGDLTDTATEKEYEWSRDILKGLKCPWVALIGNHDFLGTGDQIYETMYGDMDFSFIAGRVKFICLNTNATEYDYMAAVPNFDYMEEQFTEGTDKFDRTILLMHAAPYSDQFNNNVCKAFRRYLDFAPGLMCCVYGHDHQNTWSKIYDDLVKEQTGHEDDLWFYGIDCAQHRNYCILTINPYDPSSDTNAKDSYEIKNITF